MVYQIIMRWLLFSALWLFVMSEQSSKPDPTTISTTNEDPLVSASTCNIDDFACLAMAANDRLGLEAIRALHRKLDDDQNGNVDLSESDDFLREELQYASDYERRQKAFHRNDDFHVSVKELWEAWLKSEVHNWTVEETTEWLNSNVALPQYASTFVAHKVTGANLPRLAVNNANYLNILGIKDPIHRQKIALKAMDVVLFGPPKDWGPLWKDRILIMLVVIIGISGTYAYRQHKRFKSHLNRMSRDMDSLQTAEKALENLQRELELARQVQETVITEKQNLEKRLQDSQTDLDSLPASYSDLEVCQLKEEIEMLRTELQLAKSEVQDRSWSPPAGLQQWLQLTYEIENKAYLKKKLLAEKQLQQAREACEKLRKKRSSLVGAFVSTHGKSIDDVDRSIVEARTSLNEVTQELQERAHRWKQVEILCGFNIINNSGLQLLETMLYRNSNHRTISLKAPVNNQDDVNDDVSSVYGSQIGSDTVTWKESDSSGSETSRAEQEDSVVQNVQFIVGNGISPWNEDTTAKPLNVANHIRSSSNDSIKANLIGNYVKKKSPLIRSMSQEINVSNIPTREITLVRSGVKSSHSDIMMPEARRSPLHPAVIKEVSLNVNEEDVCSTDSSLIEDDVKKRKRKLFQFTKKSKGKVE